MKISYRYQGETTNCQMEQGAQVLDLLKQLEVPPDAVLVTLSSQDGMLDPIPLTRAFQEGDLVELITIASGG